MSQPNSAASLTVGEMEREKVDPPPAPSPPVPVSVDPRSVDSPNKVAPAGNVNEGFELQEGLPDGSNGHKQTPPPYPNTPASSVALPMDNVAAKQRKRRERDPLWLCKKIAERPKTAFALTLLGHMLMLIITAVLRVSGYDILPITFDRIPLEIRDNEDYLRSIAWANRAEDDDIISHGSPTTKAVKKDERSVRYEVLQIIFEEPGGNVLTKANLKLMEKVEKELVETEKFQEFCQVDTETNQCIQPSSILRYFDGTYSHVSNIFNDPDYDNVIKVLDTASTNKGTKVGLQNFLGKDTVLTSTTANTAIVRGYIFLGLPLAGFDNETHDEDQQEKLTQKFMESTLVPICDKYAREGVGEMDFIYNSRLLFSSFLFGQVTKDMSLALGSLAFIFIFMRLQTGSFWITGFAVLSIVTSFTGANLVYRVVLDFRYFGIFHVLALFIILGIGADDIFVFCDTWRETAYHSYPSLAHRLSDTYRRASLAMLFTSLTTAIAFIVSSTSPFLGISSFGVFAGLLVAVNYISVIIFLPTVVVTHHVYWEKYRCCCCCPQRILPGNTNDTVDQENTATGDTAIPKGTVDSAAAHGTVRNSSTKRSNFAVRFFSGPYYKLVTHKVFRWVILGVMLVILAVSIYFAAQLKVNEEQIKFVKDDTNLGKYIERQASAFKMSDDDNRGVSVYIIWGLKNQELKDCHHTDNKCMGSTVWDDSFDLNSIEAQQGLLDFCHTLKSLPEEEMEKLHIRKNLLDGSAEVDCFIDNMQSFYKAEGNRAAFKRYPLGTTFGVPFSKENADNLIKYNGPIYDQSAIKPGFNRYFEMATSFWLNNGFNSPYNGEQFKKYRGLLEEGKDPPYTIENILPPENKSALSKFPLIKNLPTEINYFYGTRLKCAAIRIKTTLRGATLGFPKGLPIRDAWEAFVKREIAKLPAGLKGGFQATADGVQLWHWLKVQETLVSSALIGIGVGIGLTLPILVIATHNVVVGFMATVTICCVTISVIGTIPLVGWKLGFLESLNLVLVVGLAVDYVVHLAEGYSRSEHEDRLGRTHDTLQQVGVSVLSGAATTLGSSLFLLFATILFFVQFGVFVFCTIGFSLLYALGLFVPLMALMGPQKEFGSLKVLYRYCGAKFCTCCNKDQ